MSKDHSMKAESDVDTFYKVFDVVAKKKQRIELIYK